MPQLFLTYQKYSKIIGFKDLRIFESFEIYDDIVDVRISSAFIRQDDFSYLIRHVERTIANNPILKEYDGYEIRIQKDNGSEFVFTSDRPDGFFSTSSTAKSLKPTKKGRVLIC